MGSPDPSDDGEPLPAHLATRPATATAWPLPTAWLLGTQLTASMRDMVAASLTQADVRDWMDAGGPIDLTALATDDQPMWLDFLADTGDSPLLVYRLAYLLQQATLDVVDGRGAPLPARLPRGQALVIGGDTAYPVADHTALLERVRAPFVWARQQLRADGQGADLPRDVPIVAIPGNHDYYNDLAGHVRMFRAPAATAPPAPGPTLALPGYRRVQAASYFALTLPHGWELWGLDVEFRGLDRRQAGFFRELHVRDPDAARIVVTSKPAVVYHGLSPHAGELATILDEVGLAGPQPFLRDGALAPDQLRLDLSGDVHVYERYWGVDGATVVDGDDADAAQAIQRQDLAPALDALPPPPAAPAPAAPTPIAEDSRGAPASAGNYASVVSGLGGAFHHPGQIRTDRHPPRRSWPRARASCQAVGGRLLRPVTVFQAGAVGLAGAALATLCFALTYLARREAAGDLYPHNVLDLPLMRTWGTSELGHFLRVAAVVVAVLAAAALSLKAIALGRWLRASGGPTRRSWQRGCARLVASRPVWWLASRLGAHRDNVHAVAVTAPAWLTIGALWSALATVAFRWSALGDAADGFVPVYVVVTVLVVAHGALGALVAPSVKTRRAAAGAAHPVVTHRGVVARVLLAALAVLTAALIVWTPYAWTRVLLAGGTRWVLLAVLPIYRLLQLAIEPCLAAGAGVRRAALVAWYAVVVAGLALAPIVAAPTDGLPAPPWWSIPIATLWGAYLTCLWLGWYFLLALQWNAHGNEAGGAARVVDYAEFVRIKLTRDRAEVFVIGAGAGPVGATWWQRLFRLGQLPPVDRVGGAVLVDHFTISRAARGAAATARTAAGSGSASR
ncbi:MAG: hypothetical protein R3B06_12155 [Kofleriaceae bacterium]